MNNLNRSKKQSGFANDFLVFSLTSFVFGSLVTGIFLHLFVINKISKEQVACKEKIVFTKEIEEKIPVNLSILTNPMVQQWRGNVKGKLISKTDHTITLEDIDGNQITITDLAASGEVFKWIFFDKPVNNEAKQISLEEISVGSTLLGEFWIFQDGKNVPLGGMFKIVN